MKPILVLDLGGVLVDLGNPATAMGLDISDDEFWTHWIGSASVQAYEAGDIAYEEFVRQLVADFPAAARQVGERLPEWRLELFPGIDTVLRDAASHFRFALLSNTSGLHWTPLSSSQSVFDVFDALFLSFETRLLKPDPNAFLQVARHCDCAPEEINFFDDSATNVEAAAAAGIAARQVVGPDELRRQIASLQEGQAREV